MALTQDQPAEKDKLRIEAKALLMTLLTTEGSRSVLADKLVDCIISAAVLEVADQLEKAIWQ